MGGANRKSAVRSLEKLFYRRHPRRQMGISARSWGHVAVRRKYRNALGAAGEIASGFGDPVFHTAGQRAGAVRRGAYTGGHQPLSCKRGGGQTFPGGFTVSDTGFPNLAAAPKRSFGRCETVGGVLSERFESKGRK